MEKGQKFVLTTEDIQGDNQRVSITYKKLPLCIQPGAMILLNDGLIELEVQSIENNNIVCSVIEGGVLTNNKSLNIPNCRINMPYLSKQDEEDLIFGVKNDVDYIAMSFVRSADDVKEVRNLLNQRRRRNRNYRQDRKPRGRE